MAHSSDTFCCCLFFLFTFFPPRSTLSRIANEICLLLFEYYLNWIFVCHRSRQRSLIDWFKCIGCAFLWLNDWNFILTSQFLHFAQPKSVKRVHTDRILNIIHKKIPYFCFVFSFCCLFSFHSFLVFWLPLLSVIL